MELIELMRNRRSVRLFTDETVPQEKIEKVLQAALMSASGRSIRPWEFVVVQDKEEILKLSECRPGVNKTIAGSNVAVVVVADEEKSGIWIEDCSIAMANMYLMAEEQGVGGVWIHCRERETPDGGSTEEYVKNLLGVPANFRVLAMFCFGVPAVHSAPYELDQLNTKKVHYGKF